MNKLRALFEETTKNVTNKPIIEQTKATIKDGHALKCDDQFVAIIEITDDRISFVENDILSVNRIERQEHYKNTPIDTIAIILESPHKKKFENKNNIDPALGITGINLSNILHDDAAKIISINDLQSPEIIFGKIDAIKLKSSLTLFYIVMSKIKTYICNLLINFTTGKWIN